MDPGLVGASGLATRSIGLAAGSAAAQHSPQSTNETRRSISSSLVGRRARLPMREMPRSGWSRRDACKQGAFVRTIPPFASFLKDAMIRVFATTQGIILERDSVFRRPTTPIGLDEIFTAEDPGRRVAAAYEGGVEHAAPAESTLLAPIQNQEIWASGVTYLRSMTARMEEAREAGGGNFYDRVYHAERPELFFKATP